MIRTIESYAKQSYQTYRSKINQLTRLGKGHREAISEAEYIQTYIERKTSGVTTAKLAEELAQGAVVFTYNEALRIADVLINAGAVDSVWNFEPTNKKAELARQIMTLTPMQAHDFVANAIDEGVYVDGGEFEGYTC